MNETHSEATRHLFEETHPLRKLSEEHMNPLNWDYYIPYLPKDRDINSVELEFRYVGRGKPTPLSEEDTLLNWDYYIPYLPKDRDINSVELEFRYVGRGKPTLLSEEN